MRRVRELRGLAQHAKERSLRGPSAIGGRKHTGRAKGPLRRIETLLLGTPDKTKVRLSCGHVLWADARTTYQVRCWLCGRIERGECLSCSTPLPADGGPCPNMWDGTGGTVPPRGKHA